MNPNPNQRPFLHSSPTFALYGRDLTLHAIKRGSETSAVGTELDYSVNGGTLRTCKLAVTGTYAFDDMKYTVLSATIPAADLSVEGELTYSLYESGKKSGVYTVPIVREGKLPPIAITEIYGRCKHPAATHYFEIINPTEQVVDLYDYKLMMHHGEVRSETESVRENMLAEEPGKMLLRPGEVAVLRFIPASLHLPENGAYLSEEAFCAALSEQVFAPAETFTKESMRIIPLELSRLNEETQVWEPKVNSFELSIKYHAITLLIVPRGGSYESAVYRLVYNDVAYHLDTPVRFASTWGLDIRRPETAYNLTHHSRMTPGRLDVGQAIPNLHETAVPSILPLGQNDCCYLADGDFKLRFAVFGSPAFDAQMHLITDTDSYITLQAQRTEDENIWQVSVPHRMMRKLPRLQYYLTVTGSFREAMLGNPEACLITQVLDNEGPALTKMTPCEGYGLLDRIPTFCVCYEDISGIDVESGILCVDGKNVTGKAKWTSRSVNYTPTKELKIGTHQYEIFLRDKLGNKTYRKIHFTVADPKEMNCYRGEVHSHTGDSDGMLDPAAAIEYARDIGGADYFAVTDHSHHIGKEYYERQIEIANAYDDPGRFAAIYGWEMTYNADNGLWGHMNILNTEWMEQDIHGVSLTEIYDKLKADPNSIGMFNHPTLTWGNFDEFDHWDEKIDRQMMLNEIKGAGYDREYLNSLHKGWHAAPVFNEDNHGINWTTATQSTGVVLAPALTRDNVLDAFRARRTYSTGDPTLKLYYTVNGEWLGSHLVNPEKLDVCVRVETESEAGIGVIQLVAEDGMIVGCVDVGARQCYEWKFTLPPHYDYYYVRITNNKIYTVSAPVWIDGAENGRLSITELKLGSNDHDYRPNSFAVRFANLSDATMTDVCVRYYLTGVGGPDLTRSKPYETVHLKNMLAGTDKTVIRTLPDLPGMRRVTAIVTAKVDGKTYCDTDFTMLTPVMISEVLPTTAAYVTDEGDTIPDAYRFVELYNTSNREQNMSGSLLRLWTLTGKVPQEKHIQPLDGIVIPPKSCVVLWICPADSPMTTDDFNLRFGTALVEGKNLFRVDRVIADGAPAARRVDLVMGGEIVSRVAYNVGLAAKGADVHPERSIVYAYRPTITGTSIKLNAQAMPTPGSLLGEQRLPSLEGEPRREEKKAAARREFAQKHEKGIKTGKRVAGAVATAAFAAAALKAIYRKK